MNNVDLDAAEKWAALYDETESPNAVKIVRALIAELRELRAAKADTDALRKMLLTPDDDPGEPCPQCEATYSDEDEERVARAMQESKNFAYSWAEAPEWSREVYREYARAAFKAMGMKHG